MWRLQVLMNPRNAQPKYHYLPAAHITAIVGKKGQNLKRIQSQVGSGGSLPPGRALIAHLLTDSGRLWARPAAAGWLAAGGSDSGGVGVWLRDPNRPGRGSR